MQRKRVPLFEGMEAHSGENTERTQSAHTANTERTHPDYSNFSDTELVTFSIRLTQGDKRRLEEYFARRGVAVSAGVRQMIVDFLGEAGG